ncbi:hypothetical protein AWZ03_006033 [Drosophila navojoa]|uniref:Uncharacterized protein n=1 Tax=Drosophila navojoa TaxID=7232 RepID=A0A484BFY6_DRONA|nr:hypothetical protein AWZ03_006033 [Drosophila navojoa]
MINELPHYFAKINVAHCTAPGPKELAMLSLGQLPLPLPLPSPCRIINRSYFYGRLKYQNVSADSDRLRQSAPVAHDAATRKDAAAAPHMCLPATLDRRVLCDRVTDSDSDSDSDFDSGSGSGSGSKSESEAE